MRASKNCNDNQPTPTPPAAGRFGIVQGMELRTYRPLGCPSIEQFEARFSLANDQRDPPRAA